MQALKPFVLHTVLIWPVLVLFVALIFGMVNAFVKPLLAFATCGLYVLTLGLFHFVINALMLQITAWLVGPSFVVEDFWSAFLGALVISIVGTVGTALLDPGSDDEPGSKVMVLRR